MSGYAPGTLRVWDGTSWRYASADWAVPSFETIRDGLGTNMVSTSVSCTRDVAVVHKGSPVTIAAITTGVGGTLDFCHGVSPDPVTHTRFATKAVAGGGATVSVSHTPKVSSYYSARFSGSPGYRESISNATGLVTVRQVTTVTKRVNMRWWRAYNGSGARLVGTGVDDAVHQGYYSTTHGNRKTLLGYDTTLPADIEITQVVFDCNSAWEGWYDAEGGTIVLGWFRNHDTEPFTWPVADVVVNRTRKQITGTDWTVDITPWAAPAIRGGTFDGITVGPGPTPSHEYYGVSHDQLIGSDFQLVITYRLWS